jgi:hypothetical protein
MPNWCNNSAKIKAVTPEAKELLEGFKEYLSHNPTDPQFFAWFCPMPEDQKENWYQWNITNWGTKWDSSIVRSNIEDDTIDFTEDTAWTPPVNFYEFMTDLGFEVEANYYEPGAGFYGSFSGGCDNSCDIPQGSGDWNLLRNCGDYAEEFVIDNDIDLSTLSKGDIIDINDGDSLIYVSHRLVLWRDLAEDNLAFFDSTLRDYESDIDRTCSVERDFYVVEIIRDTSKCGTEKAIMFTDSMNSLLIPEG